MEDVAGSEVGCVVHDVVEAGFRAHEDVAPNVVAEATAEIDQEVIRTVVVAAGKSIGAIGQVEPSALPSDTAHQIETYLLADARLVNTVDIKKDRAEGLAAGSAVRLLARPPGGVKAETDAPVEDNIGADIGIEAPFFGTVGESCGRRDGARIRAGRHHRSKSKHGIGLLCRGQIRQCEKSDYSREEGELSQEEPPVIIFSGG